MKNECFTTIGENGQTILWRNAARVGNYHNGIAKIWKALYDNYDGLALVNDVWEFLITEGNHTIQVKGHNNITHYEISVEKAKAVIRKNWIPPNRVEKVFQHLIKRTDLEAKLIGLYESQPHS